MTNIVKSYPFVVLVRKIVPVSLSHVLEDRDSYQALQIAEHKLQNQPSVKPFHSFHFEQILHQTE